MINKKNKSIININKNKLSQLNQFKNKNGSINLNDFKNIMSESILSNDKNEFSFLCNISKENNTYIIEFKGKHFAKNVIQNRWHRGILLKYKKSIKDASKNGFLIARTNDILPKEPLTKVSIIIEVYNPKSRDDDANYDTLKWIRDTLTVNKLLLDDNRSIILDTKEKEVISKDWKIIFYVKDLL